MESQYARVYEYSSTTGNNYRNIAKTNFEEQSDNESENMIPEEAWVVKFY
jgi:hypothetical protein